MAAPPRSASMPVPRFALDVAATRAIPTLPPALAPRPLWKKRRFWILSGGAAILVGTLSTAIVRGRHTRIIIINSGSATLPALTVSASGHRHDIPPLESGASHRWVLPDKGTSTPIIVKPSAPDPESPELQWVGSPFEPGRGARRILHLNSDGSMEESSSSSIWLDLIGS